MASSDYKLCDLCNAKVFYDANIEDERYCQTWGKKSKYAPIGLKAICGDCNKTHDVVIVPRTVDTQSSDIARPAPTLAEALADPVAVHANMLRGRIAKPTLDQIIHLYGADALRAALARIGEGGE